MKRTTLKAFTLAEVMVVLVIIGILVLIALPNLMPLIGKTKSTEAKLQLQHVVKLEQMYRYTYSKYSKDLNAIDFLQEKLVEEGGKANYRIEITEASNNSFTARAVSTVDFNGNGVYNVWEIDQDNNLIEVTKD